MEIPETRYAKTADGVQIAYQVLGEGPLGFVLVNSAYISNVEIAWEWERTADQFRWLAARGRLVLFDRRGTGLSDGVSAETLPSLEARMDDIRAVMDAAGLDRNSAPAWSGRPSGTLPPKTDYQRQAAGFADTSLAFPELRPPPRRPTPRGYASAIRRR